MLKRGMAAGLAVLGLVIIVGICAVWIADRNLLGDSVNSRIILSPQARQLLNERYTGLDGEFAGCLDIRQHEEYTEGNSSLQTSYELVGITGMVVSAGTNYVNHDFCEYGIVHSHKGGSCSFSLADIYSTKARFRHGEMLAVLMCGKDDFYYITRNDFEEKKII